MVTKVVTGPKGRAAHVPTIGRLVDAAMTTGIRVDTVWIMREPTEKTALDRVREAAAKAGVRFREEKGVPGTGMVVFFPGIRKTQPDPDVERRNDDERGQRE